MKDEKLLLMYTQCVSPSGLLSCVGESVECVYECVYLCVSVRELWGERERRRKRVREKEREGDRKRQRETHQ